MGKCKFVFSHSHLWVQKYYSLGYVSHPETSSPTFYIIYVARLLYATTVLSFSTMRHLMRTVCSWGEDHHLLDFAEEKTGTWKCKVIFPMPHGWEMMKPRLKPWWSDPRAGTTVSTASVWDPGRDWNSQVWRTYEKQARARQETLWMESRLQRTSSKEDATSRWDARCLSLGVQG